MFDGNSNKLGATVAKRNEKLVKLLNGVGDMNLGDVRHHDIDLTLIIVELEMIRRFPVIHDPLNSMIKSAEEKARWSELKSAASSTAFERVMAYRVGKVSQTNIAKRENRNRVTIVRSISKAEIAIRAKALQMILDKRFPGIILKAEDTNERGDNNGDQ